MFSISTMASSTRMPTTRVRASRVTTFSEKPISCMTKNVGISDIGMAKAVIRVERQSRRNSSTTRAARNMPSIRTCRVALKLSRVSSTVAKMRVNLIPGWTFSIFASSAITSSSTATSLDSRVFITWKPTTGRPLSLAKPRTSDAPSPMSATSVSFTKRPPSAAMVRLRSWSTVCTEPSTRRVCSRPPNEMRPPGLSWL